MAGKKLRLDHPGIAGVLKSGEVASAIDGLTAAVASRASHTTARGTVIPVKTDSYTTDRAAGAVILAHPAGRSVEAKHGVLAGAAASAGLEVRSKPAAA